ncbi:MAG: response regulator transcription factor [Bacillus subtilis]|nr:response regulator transcription factor [Bacillus subtilis]
MKIKVLLIEDNHVIHHVLAEAMNREGFVVYSAFTGVSGLELFHKEKIDIILLDLMLPDIDGEKVLQTVRKTSNTPIMIVSSKDTDVDKAIHLGLGADDYLAKPFSMIELVARVKAVVRRSKTKSEEQNSIKKVGDIEFNLANYEAFKNGERIPLTLKEAKILELLFTNPNTTFSKKQIYEAVWKEEYYHDDNVINVHMRRIREKVESSPSDPQIIKTVWGVGYQFISSGEEE